MLILLVGVAAGVPAVSTHTRMHVTKTYVSVFFQWTYYQRRKMFYDESWIIDYNDIRKGTLVAIHSKCLAFNNFLLLLQIMATAVS